MVGDTPLNPGEKLPTAYINATQKRRNEVAGDAAWQGPRR